MSIERLFALAHVLEDGRTELRSPEVGLWLGGPAVGRVMQPEESLGQVEILGFRRRLVVPRGIAGRVVDRFQADRARPALGYGTVLVVVDPAAVGLDPRVLESSGQARVTGMVLTAPMGGRYYPRPAPGKPAFVSPGDVIETGHTVALIEVMKTFNRVTYGGPGLPSPARVTSVLRSDEEDVAPGDPLFEVEPA